MKAIGHPGYDDDSQYPEDEPVRAPSPLDAIQARLEHYFRPHAFTWQPSGELTPQDDSPIVADAKADIARLLAIARAAERLRYWIGTSTQHPNDFHAGADALTALDDALKGALSASSR